MQQYARPAVQIDDMRLIQQVQTGTMTKLPAEQKIPIPVQERHPRIVICQRAKPVGNCAFEYPDRVVADPGFEQIAQYV